MDQIVVKRGRVTKIQVSLGYDVSNDTFVSQIRSEDDSESDLLATWDISFLTDGVDGELVFQIDDSDRTLGDKSIGYMDIKRVSGGKPIDVFDEVLEVVFKETITV